MKHLLLLTALAVLSIRHQTLSCRAHGRNFSDMEPVLVQSVKKKLLRELGLSSVPNITKWRVPNVPPYFRHLVESRNKKFEQRAKIKDDSLAKIKQIFLFPTPVVSVTNALGKHYLFESKPSHTKLEIKSATLWVHIRDKNSQFSDSAQLENYELRFFTAYLAGLADSSRTGRQKPFLSKQFNYTGWHTFKMTDMIRKWFSQQGLHLGLNIQIVGKHSLELGGPRNVDGPLQPFMVVDTDKVAGRNRRKRGVDLHWCPSPSTTTCCLHDVEIKFQDIGWDFVIMPVILHINACSGNCDSQAYYKNLERGRALKWSYTSCCVPRKMASISMLYYDNDLKVTYKVVPNMIANSCQCII